MEKADVAPSSKLAYEKPRLVSYGDLRTITRGGGGTMADGAAATMMCWVAEVLYGETDPRTQLLRCWLANIYSESLVGNVLVRLYRAFGRPVARMAERSAGLRTILHRVFDAGLQRAQRHYMTASCR